MRKFFHLKNSIFENKFLISFFLISFILYFIKLDYHYFFTDEILYYQKGVDMLDGIFDNTLQVPPFQKYLAGISFLLFNPDLFLMRVPFAVFGFACSIVIFMIVKKETNVFYGILASSLYLFGKIIFDSSRMMMLEPVLHFFWLLFLYFFYSTISNNIYTDKDLRNGVSKSFILAGLFLGLSFATKVTSILLLLLIFAVFVLKYRENKKIPKVLIKNYILMLVVGFFTLFVFYIPQLYYSGIWNSIKDTIKDLIEVYFSKSTEGKEHVINGEVYVKSPWWFYFDAQVRNDGILITAFKYIFGLIAIVSRNKFAYFWGIVFILTFSFHQLSGVKNTRYISTFEIPLIVLSSYGFFYLLNSILKVREVLQKFIIGLIVLLSLLNIANYLTKLKHTEYLGVFNYFKKETSDFQIKKRIFVFGSIRTLKYYTKLLPEERFLTYKRQYNIYCPEFNEYTYFAFDREELIKDPENDLYRFVNTYIDNFERVSEIDDMIVYKKISEFNYSEFCK